jgi:fibrillarin-like pre-rRNA processing protein
MEKSKIFEVYEEKRGKRRNIYTKSLAPGTKVYNERILRKGGTEYREWDPRRSKLCAAIMKGVPNIFLRKGDVVLYLGASTGTTASHVSDIVGRKGFVFALDFAPRVVRDLVYVCEERKNMAPMLEDALHPENYKDKMPKKVDFIFQDIAQRDQVRIFLKNVDAFLKPGGYAHLVVKSRSIDVAKKPKDVFRKVRTKLENNITIIDSRDLSPFEMDHMIFICKKK